MNLIEFTNNLKDPQHTSVEQTAGLKNIIDEFPYFHAAHFLYLNGLKNQTSFKYNKYLKKTAAYTTDRSVLFDYISSKQYNQEPVVKEVKPSPKVKEPTVQKTDTISSDTAAEVTTKTTDSLPIGKPLQFDHSETHSFSEWLQITSAKPIQRKEFSKEDTADAKSNQSNFDIIDNFISKNPKIKPSISNSNSDIAKASVTENESLMTETLAHVYLEQKKYQKAITAFTVLSLKYPEKSGFFANQIKAIQKLQEK